MKKLHLLLFMAFATALANAQVPSSCMAPPELETFYYKDIAQLATNYLSDIQSPDTIYVHIPQPVLDEIGGGLAAIMNAVSIPESDSVFNLYCIHDINGPPYDYAGFLVSVDTSYSWTQAWQNLVTVTGNGYVDSLTSQYGLHITNFYNWSFGNYAELGVDSAWNILALMDSIRYAPGVISVEPNTLIGGAGTIGYARSGNDRYYDFYFEYNDCFDGCDNYRKWSFKVDSTCNVYYLGFTDWGIFGPSPLPAPLNCNIFTSVHSPSDNSIVLYPNPSTGLLKLKMPSGQHNFRNISIYNALGIEVSASSNIADEIVSFDISPLYPGLYTVVLKNEEGVLQQSFIRQ